jgi:hypothetical protein
MVRTSYSASARRPASVIVTPTPTERLAACLHALRAGDGEAGAHEPGRESDREAGRQHDRLGDAVRRAGEHFERPAVVGGYQAFSRQFGRTSAPMIPHFVHPRPECWHRLGCTARPSRS